MWNSISGLQTMNHRFRLASNFVTVFVVASFSIQAEELVRKAEPESRVKDKPDIGFLEFLGEWETDSGDWVDPNQLEERVASANKKEQENESH